MSDEPFLSGLRNCGIDFSAHVESWRELTDLLAAFDAIGRSGSNAIVKIDGGREGPDVYTVVVSGGRLGQLSFRKDGADLRALLRDGLSFFIAHAEGERSDS